MEADRKRRYIEAEQNSKFSQHSNSRDESGGESHAREHDCFHCRLAGPGKLCSYCSWKAKQNQLAETEAKQDNFSFPHQNQDLQDESAGESYPGESDCFHCRLAGPGKLCSYCGWKGDQKRQPGIEVELNRKIESEEKHEVVGEQSTQVPEVEQVCQTSEAEQNPQAVEAEQRRQAIEAGQERQAIEAEQRRQAIEAEQKRQTIEAEQSSQPIDLEQEHQAIQVEQRHQTIQIEQNQQATEAQHANSLDESDSRECPYCASQINKIWLFCKFCHATIPHSVQESADTAQSRPHVYFDINTDPEIADADAKLKEAESRYGPNDVMVAKYLGAYASLLRSKGIRPLDASMMEAQEKAIRAQYSGQYDTQTCPRCQRTILKQATICRFCNCKVSSDDQASHLRYATSGDYTVENGKVSSPDWASYLKYLPPATVSGDRIQVNSEQARDPVLCAFLSGCCITGGGQMLLGQYGKGLAILLGSIVLGFMSNGLSWLVILPLSATDAYKNADKLKKGQSIGKWEWF